MRGREVADEADAEIFNAIASADWYYEGQLFQLADVEEAEQCFDGYLSGIKDIDDSLGGFFFKQLIIHTGDTKHGKSAGVNQCAAMAVKMGGKVCIWAGEDNIEDFKYKFYVHIAGYDGTEAKTSARTQTEYAKVLPEWRLRIDEFVRDRVIVLNSRTGVTEDVLLENFKLAFQRFGCDTFVVDNLMKIVAGKSSDNINFRQAQICNLLSDFAKSYRVTVHLVTHTNKTGDDNEPPTRRSVSGAKEIINLADRVLSWWRIPEAAKPQYGHHETLISILADRVFGNEGSKSVRYDRLIKRYGQSVDELCRDYLSQNQT
jgi:replicative DNA helicase